MPKLFQINTTVNVGSHGRIVEEIARVAISKGWHSYIAYGREIGSMHSTSSLIRVGTRIGIWWHGVLTRLFDMHGLGSAKATQNLIRKIEKINPDIIHLHNIHGYYLNYEILFDFLESKDIPVVWTLHDCWAFTGHCSHFDYIGCNKWKTNCVHCPQRHEYPYSFIDNSKINYQLKKEKFCSVRNLTIVSVSSWLRSMVECSFLKEADQLVIYNGVDMSNFRHCQCTLDVVNRYQLKDKYVLLGVANVWSASKGLSSYIALRKRLPKDFVVILVGLSRSQINCLPEGIIGVERTNNLDELVELYSCADISLNLSSQESLGMTTIEALACGTPCIVYNATASPELVTEDTGIVVEKNDIQSLEMAVYHIIEKGKKSYAQACRQRALDCFDKEKQYSKYIELYDTLLKRNI